LVSCVIAELLVTGNRLPAVQENPAACVALSLFARCEMGHSGFFSQTNMTAHLQEIGRREKKKWPYCMC